MVSTLLLLWHSLAQPGLESKAAVMHSKCAIKCNTVTQLHYGHSSRQLVANFFIPCCWRHLISRGLTLGTLKPHSSVSSVVQTLTPPRGVGGSSRSPSFTTADSNGRRPQSDASNARTAPPWAPGTPQHSADCRCSSPVCEHWGWAKQCNGR